jgi:hypothetical protein
MAFSAGSAGRFGSSSGYTLHTIDRLTIRTSTPN